MSRSPAARMLCPPRGEGRSASFPGRHEPLPAVDERMAPPETRVEYLEGRELYAVPADEPHASQHSQIDRVVGAHVRSPYRVAVDMLTRTEIDSDFAPDVSVYEPLLDPRTGAKIGRKLEEIAFEVVHHQAQAVPTRKALDLVARGVRRVFCVFVNEHSLCEWSAKDGHWQPLAEGALIDDPCFVRPITARALIDLVLADDEVARALLVKRPPAIVEALAESRAEGALEEQRRSVLRLLEARGVDVPEAVRARIAATSDRALLDRWFVQALTVTRAGQLGD